MQQSLKWTLAHLSIFPHDQTSINLFKVVSEWKAKADDIAAEIDASQKEGRNFNSELFRLKAAHDETIEQLDVVKRENKNLADEIRYYRNFLVTI